MVTTVVTTRKYCLLFTDALLIIGKQTFSMEYIFLFNQGSIISCVFFVNHNKIGSTVAILVEVIPEAVYSFLDNDQFFNVK